MPTENDTLTPEQAAALGHYRARWAAIRRSTAPANRSAAKEGARLAYRAAALQPPARFVWCESPIALAHLTRRIARADGTNVKTALLRRQRRQVASLVRRHLPAHVRAAVASAVNPADSLVASANDAITRNVVRDTAPLLERIRRSRALSWHLRTLFGLSGLNEAVGQHEFAWRIAEDESGVLWRKVWRSFDAWAVVEVVNEPPRLTARASTFVLQVPANIRTAREAVAWTYGMSEHAYSRLSLRT